MIITFNHIGSSLGTRKTGQEVRVKIESALRASQKVVFDFADVDVVSNSFADETFGKLLLQFDLNFVKQHTTFRNANAFVQHSIAFALRDRLAKAAI